MYYAINLSDPPSSPFFIKTNSYYRSIRFKVKKPIPPIFVYGVPISRNMERRREQNRIAQRRFRR